MELGSTQGHSGNHKDVLNSETLWDASPVSRYYHLREGEEPRQVQVDPEIRDFKQKRRLGKNEQTPL